MVAGCGSQGLLCPPARLPSTLYQAGRDKKGAIAGYNEVWLDNPSSELVSGYRRLTAVPATTQSPCNSMEQKALRAGRKVHMPRLLFQINIRKCETLW